MMQYSGNKPTEVGFWFFCGSDFEHLLCKVQAHVNHMNVSTFYITPFHATMDTSSELDSFIAANGCNAYAGPVPIPTW